MLQIKNLHVWVGKLEIVKGVSLIIRPSQLHVLMGPNGSGKSTLAQAVMGNPEYKIPNPKHQIQNKSQAPNPKFKIDKRNLLGLSADKRGRLGLFLAFQQPIEVPGVSVGKFLWQAYQNVKCLPRRQAGQMPASPAGRSNVKSISIIEFNHLLKEKAKLLQMEEKFLERGLNEGFSGGERKKLEMLQLLVLEPKYAIIDEIDTGLDIDSLKLAAKCINTLIEKKAGILLITHYQRLLKFLKPDFVAVMIDGKIVNRGRADLATKIEKEGYRSFVKTAKAAKLKNKIIGN